MFAIHFLCCLGDGLSHRQLKHCADQFFTAIYENPDSSSNSNSNSTRYFYFFTWRKGWRQSPYFVPENEEEEEYVSEEGDSSVRVLKSRPGQQRIIVSDSTDCAICLNQLKEGSIATRLSCSHSFHGYCIVQWLIRHSWEREINLAAVQIDGESTGSCSYMVCHKMDCVCVHC